jgi:hypothetical protein
MAKVKKQHYVPQFYLKNFAKQINGEYFVNCFDKSNFKEFKVNISDIACEKYFYEISDIADNAFEKVLSDFEGQVVKTYNKIISCKSLSCLKWREKEIFAKFVVLQELRTRENREHLRDMAQSLDTWLSDKQLSEKMSKEIKELNSEESIRKIQLKQVGETLLERNQLSNMLLDLKWSILENNTKIPFWTSDHPINRHNPTDYEPYGNLGTLCTGIQIFFPLTPKLSIAFYDPITYFNMCDKEICCKDNVLFYNTLQLQTNTRHIFSVNSDFAIAEKWLTENPSSKSINRKRISTSPKVPKNYDSDDYRYDPTFRYFYHKRYSQ